MNIAAVPKEHVIVAPLRKHRIRDLLIVFVSLVLWHFGPSWGHAALSQSCNFIAQAEFHIGQYAIAEGWQSLALREAERSGHSTLIASAVEELAFYCFCRGRDDSGIGYLQRLMDSKYGVVRIEREILQKIPPGIGEEHYRKQGMTYLASLDFNSAYEAFALASQESHWSKEETNDWKRWCPTVAYFYAEKHRYAEARYFASCGLTGPNSFRSLYMLANTYIQESQLAKAEVLLESLVMMEPASYEDALLVEKATGELAQIYFKQGRSIEEQQRLCRETSRMGCFGPPPSALAQICIQTGDYSKAESILNAHITSPVEITKSYKADYCDLYALLLKKTGRTQESAAWEKHGNALHQQNKHRSLAELYWDCAQDHARDHNLRHAMLFFALCAEQTRLADPHDDNRALEELSKYYSVAGDYGNLKQALFERLSIAEFQKNKASMVQIWCEIGQSLLAQNQLTAAESAVQKGVEILDELIAGKEPGVTMQYAEKLQSLVHDLRSRGNTRAVANLQRRIDRLSRTIGT